MQLKKLIAGFFILISVSIYAETNPNDRKKETNTNTADSIQIGIDYLKKHIRANNVWKSENPEILRTLNGLIHFAEDERIDTILVKLEKFQKTENFRYLNRSPMHVSDSLQLSGYLPYPAILEKMKQLDRAIWNGVDMKAIPLTEELKAAVANKVEPIAAGDDEEIIRRTHIVLPDSLKNVHAIPDSLMKTANDFNRIKKRQEVRTSLLEAARQRFNSKISKQNLDSTDRKSVV